MHTYTYISVLRDFGRAIYKGKNSHASNSALQGENCKVNMFVEFITKTQVLRDLAY